MQNKQISEERLVNLFYMLGTYCIPDTVPVNEQARQSLCNLGTHILGKTVWKEENKGIKTKKKPGSDRRFDKNKIGLCVTETQGDYFTFDVKRCF